MYDNSKFSFFMSENESMLLLRINIVYGQYSYVIYDEKIVIHQLIPILKKISNITYYISSVTCHTKLLDIIKIRGVESQYKTYYKNIHYYLSVLISS